MGSSRPVVAETRRSYVVVIKEVTDYLNSQERTRQPLATGDLIARVVVIDRKY